MGSQGREEMFWKILVFFAITSAMFSIFNLSASNQITLETFGSDTLPGQTITGISVTEGYVEGANTANGTILTNIDFTTATSLNPNVTTIIGGPWTLTAGTGLVLTGLPILPGTINPSAVIVRNGQSTGQVYTTNVKIVNLYAHDFYVFPRYITGYSGSDLKVVFSYDGIHIKKFPLLYGLFDNGDDYFYPLSNSELTSEEGSVITTQLTETVSTQISNTPDYLSTLVVSKDGSPLFSVAVRSILPGANINDQVRHGGAGSDATGFVVMGFPNTPVLDTSTSIISGSQGTMNALTLAGNLLGLLATVFGFTPNSAIPWWLWAIVGIPCLTTLALIYIEIARGN